MAQKITDRFVKALKAPESKYRIVYDTEVQGFGLRVTRGGAKSFVLNYHIDGRERRYTIGQYPAWSVAAARQKAAELRQRIDLGEDPMDQRNARRAEPTVSDLCDQYLTDHARPKKRASSVERDEHYIERHIVPELGRLKVSHVKFTDVDGLHRRISRTAPYQANRVQALLSKMFNLAVKWGYRDDNPAKGVERNQEIKRDRYLSGPEIRQLSKALVDYPYLEKVRVGRERALEIGQKWEWRRRDEPLQERAQSCNAIRLMMLTGARKGEVLAATWDQFDLAAGVWTKPGATTKQKTAHRVPLSAPAIELLSEIKRTSESRFVFPGREEDTHQEDLKSAWATIRELAEIGDVRLHDLRHTYAAQLASAGLSLPIIGALLGHTQPQTTARYSHLMDDPLREATERVAAVYRHAETGESGEVVSIKGRK